MPKLLIHLLLLLLSISVSSLNAGWLNGLSDISQTKSVKKSYLNGLLSDKTYGSYKVDKLISKDNVLKTYEQNGYELYWFDDSIELNYNILKMIDVVKLAQNEGLDQERYHYTKIQELHQKVISGALIEDKDINLAPTNLDILLTDAFFTLTKDLIEGEIDYRAFKELLEKKSKKDDVHYSWDINVEDTDYFGLLDTLKRDGNILKGIYDLAPKSIIYKKLRVAYSNYKTIQDLGGFQKVKSGRTLKYGAKSNRIKDLSIRLNQSGDLISYDENSTKFTKDIRDALKGFQKRVSISPSGILNSTTVNALNIPVEKRLKKIKLNLERSRLEKDTLEFRHFFVNIPEFKMRFKDGDSVLFESRVIVGKKKNPTPIFQSKMSYVVLNPRWSVPNSIVVKEFLQKVQEDPYYFEDRGYKMYDGWSKNRREMDTFEVDWFEYDENSTVPFNIVKEEGAKNPLGIVKFMFPNPHAVYMHDTPTKYLFKKSVRAFSHGCIRLHKPQELLEFISPTYIGRSYKDVKLELDSGENQSLNLSEKIPVYIRYYTVYIDEEGKVNFMNDIYGYDKIEANLLKNNN